MAFDVGAEPAPEYSVSIIKPATDGDVALFEASRVAPDSEGIVRLSLHSALLVQGDYVVRLTPQGDETTPPPVPDHAAVSYRLRIAR
jgi:hypothetical protein